MIVGIGLDVVTVSRIAGWLDVPPLCERYFHEDELKAVYSRGADAPASLAARFAAKEAFAKALGTGFTGLRLRDIRVVNEQFNRPILVLKGSARAGIERLGVDNVHVSLTHEENLAAAQVILEAVNGQY